MRYPLLLLPALLSIASLGRAQDCTPPPDGLVAWWDADETYQSPGGNLDKYAMNVVNRISGVPLNINFVAVVPGHVGQGFHFPNAAGSPVAALDSRFDFTTAMSVELWLQANSTPASQFSLLAKCDPFGYFSSQNGYMLFGDFSTGKATFRVGHGSSGSVVTTTSNVIDGAWHHIAATFDASLANDNLAIYVDGVLEATTNASSPIAVNAIQLHMGVGTGDRTVDAISLYDRALTASEVARIAQAGEKCSETFPTRPRNWTEIVVSGATFNAGMSIATDGDLLATGALNYGPTPFEFVQTYLRDVNGVWQPIPMDSPIVAYQSTLSISGDLLAVGMGGAALNGGGLVIHRFNGSITSPQMVVEGAFLNIAGSGDSVGIHQDALGGDVAILGRGAGLYNSGPPPEFARIYRFSGGFWGQEAQLDNPNGASLADGFGLSVDIGDDLVVVGAPFHDDAGVGADCGALHVYRRIAGTWTLANTITPDMVDTTSPPNFNGWAFGRSVSLDGERVLVGAPYAPLLGAAMGKAYVIDLTGGNVVVEGELRPSRESTSGWYGAGFGDDSPSGWSGPRGRCVQLSGDHAVVGAKADRDDLYYVGFGGAVYVFARKNGEWSEVSKCASGTWNPGLGSIGQSAVINGDQVISGMIDRLYVFDGFAHADLPTTYCTTSTTSSGCNPRIRTWGVASASGSDDMVISVDDLEGQKSGLVFYGVSGRKAGVWAPGNTSVLCVKAPVQRTGTMFTGGTIGACDGHVEISWRNYLLTHSAALGQPFSPGDIVDAQCWFRDPAAPGTTNLSDGVEFVHYP